MFPEWKADYTVPGPESVPEQLTPCDLTSPLSSDPLDFALQGPTLRSEGGPGPSYTPSTTPQSTSAKAAVGAKTAAPVSVIRPAGQNLTGKQASKVVARKQLEDCNNLATLTPSHNNLLLLAVTAESKSGAVEEDVDTRVGNEPDTISAPAQDKVAAELAADMSGASESSLVRNTIVPAMQEQFLRQITCLWETCFSWNQTSREKFYCCCFFPDTASNERPPTCGSLCIHLCACSWLFFCGCVFLLIIFFFEALFLF